MRPPSPTVLWAHPSLALPYLLLKAGYGSFIAQTAGSQTGVCFPNFWTLSLK